MHHNLIRRKATLMKQRSASTGRIDTVRLLSSLPSNNKQKETDWPWSNLSTCVHLSSRLSKKRSFSPQNQAWHLTDCISATRSRLSMPVYSSCCPTRLSRSRVRQNIWGVVKSCQKICSLNWRMQGEMSFTKAIHIRSSTTFHHINHNTRQPTAMHWSKPQVISIRLHLECLDAFEKWFSARQTSATTSGSDPSKRRRMTPVTDRARRIALPPCQD